ELLTEIAGEDPGVDGIEATRLLDRLANSIVEEVTNDGANFTIRLKVPGAITTHVLRIPNAEEVRKFRREQRKFIDMAHGKRRMIVSPAAGGKFYDALKLTATGYTDAVPLVHRQAACDAVLQSLDELLTSDDLADF